MAKRGIDQHPPLLGGKKSFCLVRLISVILQECKVHIKSLSGGFMLPLVEFCGVVLSETHVLPSV